MAWQTEMLEMVRILINDLGCPPNYSDENLERLIIIAAFQVNNELDFSQSFEVDIGNGTISPDPIDPASKDESFINLVCIKAACIFDRGEAVKAAKNAFAIRQGFSSVDTKGVAAAKLALLLRGGWCAVYEDAKLEYQTNSRGIAGAAIMGPFRVYAASNPPRYI